MAAYEHRKISISKLEFDQQNYRIFSAQSQQEALDALVEEQDTKLVEMGKDIALHGLSPIDLFGVVKNDKSEGYIVVEGNRRLVALRLLENPLLTEQKPIQDAFKSLSGQYQKNRLSEIPCVVFPEKELAMSWVDRKQGTNMGGAGLQRAGYVQNAVRKAQKGEYEKWYAATIYLKKTGHLQEGELPEREIHKQGTGAAVERVFGTAFLSERLGINISLSGEVTFDNGDKTNGAKLLLSILRHLIKKNLTTEDVKHLAQRNEILETFLSQSVKNNANPLQTEGTRANAKEANTSEDVKKTKPTVKPSQSVANERVGVVKAPIPRSKLAPNNLGYAPDIANERIKTLLFEIQKLDITETPKGRPLIAGVIMRVFLDLTLTDFLIKSGTKTPKDIRAWDDFGAKLRAKLNTALWVIDADKTNRQLDSVRAALNSDYHHSLKELNAQLHALDAPILTQKECVANWDRYAHLFAAIFEHLAQND